jgi:hypothetical protein
MVISLYDITLEEYAKATSPQHTVNSFVHIMQAVPMLLKATSPQHTVNSFVHIMQAVPMLLKAVFTPGIQK